MSKGICEDLEDNVAKKDLEDLESTVRIENLTTQGVCDGVWLNGVDCSDMVTSIKLEVEAGEEPKVVLELMPMHLDMDLTGKVDMKLKGMK